MNYSFLANIKNFAANTKAIVWLFRTQRFLVFLKLMEEHLEARRKAKASAEHNYDVVKHSDLKKYKKSKRIFVLGSGYSLNTISDKEWLKISESDTLGFSGSFHLQKLPVTYHLFRGWVESPVGSLAWRKDAEEIVHAIDSNPFMAETVFVLQEGFTAIFTNRLIGYSMLNAKYKISFFLPDKLSRLPNRHIRSGLTHRMTGLCSAVSLAVALGYEEIVLTGVDLYDSRYFWLPEDKTLGWSEEQKKLVAADKNMRGDGANQSHNTVHNGIIKVMGEWHQFLQSNLNISLKVHNPASLLNRSMPVFSWD